MLRDALRPLLFALPLLAAACSSDEDDTNTEGGGVVLPPAENLDDRFVEDFATFTTARWAPQLDDGTTLPTSENGQLRFRWSDAPFGSTARLLLRQTGRYEAVALDVPVIESGVEVRVTMDLLANGVPRRAIVGFRGATPRFAEASVEDGAGDELERRTVRLSQLDVAPGTSDERVRIEVDVAREAIRFFFADEVMLTYSEPGLSLFDDGEVAIEVEGRSVQDTAIEGFEASVIGEVPEALLTDVIANHGPPSRVQWLFKLRDAVGNPLGLTAEQAAGLVPNVFEDDVPTDPSESCAVVRTIDALPLRVAIVLDHTVSMEAFDGIGAMNDAAVSLIGELADTHEFSIWQFHDNQDGGFGQLRAMGVGTLAEGEAVVRGYDPALRGFSLCWDTIDEVLETDFPEDGAAELRVVVFFSDGVDTSSTATPTRLVDEAQDRGVLLYCLGYGQLTPQSRANLVQLSGETNGLFFEAPELADVGGVFGDLVQEVFSFLQLAYVTGRLTDPNVDSFIDIGSLTVNDVERPIQQVVRGDFNARVLSEDDEGNAYDPQLGVLSGGAPEQTVDGVVRTVEVQVRASHVPRETVLFPVRVRLFELDSEGEIEVFPGNGLSFQVVPEPFGPFDGWSVTETPESFVLSGSEVCFGDFGALFRVRVEGVDVPDAFRIEIANDNSIYGGLLRFAGSIGGGNVVNGDWTISRSGSFEPQPPLLGAR
ncbi:MAG: vWA domain-containing protein [Planctomycetota bacterium]